MLLPRNPDAAAPLKRALPSALAALLFLMLMALSGALGLIPGAVATEICIVIALVMAGFYAMLRSGYNLRFVDSSLLTWQVGALFVLLAYASFRTADFGATLMLLYPAVMLAGMLRLRAIRLIWLSGIAVLANLIAIGAVAATSSNVNYEAIFVHIVALIAVLCLFVCAARGVGSLRSRLTLTAHQLEAELESASSKARRDTATGAYSRGYLIDVLGREIARSERTGKPLCVSYIGIDRFQELNAAVSKLPGESLLARFSAGLHAVVRFVDVLGRMGATQFMLIMPETELQKAVIGAERLRGNIEKTAVPGLAARAGMTCSIGLVCHVKGQSMEEFIEKADAVLRKASAMGGNRVIVDDTTPAPANVV